MENLLDNISLAVPETVTAAVTAIQRRAAETPLIFLVDDSHEMDQTSREILNDLVRMMDYLNVATIVNLSGGTGDRLKESVEKLDAAYPGRFVTFCNVDWAGLGEPGMSGNQVKQLFNERIVARLVNLETGKFSD